MATATKVRFRFALANNKVARPGWWIGNPTTNAAAPESELQAIVDAARAELVANSFMAGFQEDTIFQEVEAQNFTRVGAGTELDPFRWDALTTTFESAGADVPGTQVTDALPPQNAFVWTLKSSHPGPSGRNRFYGPPVPEADSNSDGTLTAGRIAQLSTDLNAIAAAIASAWSGGVGALVASAQDNELYPVIVATLQPVVRSQRRRAS